MKVTDLGKRGGEQINNLDVPRPGLEAADAIGLSFDVLSRFPTRKIEVDTADGVKKSLDVIRAPLRNGQVFRLLHDIAPAEPMVYATRLKPNGDIESIASGMLSANYDPDGQEREPTIKVLPLKQAKPLTSKLTPDEESAALLSGAVSAERAGGGSHSNVLADLEHKLTTYGAVAERNPNIALREVNHDVRRQGSSLATGLSDGRLGRIFTSDKTVKGFSGYDKPIMLAYDPQSRWEIQIPKTFLETEKAFGGSYDESPRIMAGLALESALTSHEDSDTAAFLEQADYLQAQVARSI